MDGRWASEQLRRWTRGGLALSGRGPLRPMGSGDGWWVNASPGADGSLRPSAYALDDQWLSTFYGSAEALNDPLNKTQRLLDR